MRGSAERGLAPIARGSFDEAHPGLRHPAGLATWWETDVAAMRRGADGPITRLHDGQAGGAVGRANDWPFARSDRTDLEVDS